ncbi:MAG TPA: DUF4855 domain-containing protein [Bacteroidales bacterium]|nr:DUF4855 domain-containing protein [Bacteroidales bacterium]
MKKINYIVIIGLLAAGCIFINANINHDSPAKSKPAPREADITDLVLIYHGAAHRLDWTSNEMRPYIFTENKTGFHWLFDGFLFLEIFDRINKYEYDPGFGYQTAAREQWEWLLDRYFGDKKGPDALEAVLDSLSRCGKTPLRPRKVVISIPCPVQGFAGWGELDGRKIDFGKAEDQVRVACWFIDKAMEKWKTKNYKHIRLDGFYWVHEAAGKDYGIIPQVKAYLKKKNMKLYWVPYWNAERADQWSSLGFDFAYQQPNYFFSTDIPYQRLDDACVFGSKHGLGMEMEFDHDVAKPEIRKRYYDYIKSFRENGVWDNRRVAYYEGGGAWLTMCRSQEPEMKQMVDSLTHILITRQEKADKSFRKADE